MLPAAGNNRDGTHFSRFISPIYAPGLVPGIHVDIALTVKWTPVQDRGSNQVVGDGRGFPVTEIAGLCRRALRT